MASTDLCGKAALVTGARRIGASVAAALAARGAEVAVTSATSCAEAARTVDAVRTGGRRGFERSLLTRASLKPFCSWHTTIDAHKAVRRKPMTAHRRCRTLVMASPYVRVREQFTKNADSCGADVVRHDMAEQFLAHGVVDRIFTLTLRAEEAAADSSAGGAGPIRSGGLQELQEVMANDDAVFLAGLGVMTRASRLRYLFGWDKMPLIGALFSLPSPSHTGFYYWLQAELRSRDAIVAPSTAGYAALQAIFRQTSQHSRYGMPDISRIPLGVDTGMFKRSPCLASRRTLGWPEDKIIILTLGRFSDGSKADLEPLLWAVRSMEANREVAVVCAGADSHGYAAAVKACAEGYGIAGQTSIIANFPLALKPALLAAADIFVSLADNVQETFGLALLEAMASGLPVIASDWSGYRDIVVHGETGFLLETTWSRATGAAAEFLWTTESGDGHAMHALARGTVVSRAELRLRLSDLVERPDLRARLGANGYARARTMFGWPSVVEQYRVLVERKLAEPPTSQSAGIPRLHDVFSHYASAMLPPRFFLRRGHSSPVDSGWRSDLMAPQELRPAIDTLLERVERKGRVEVRDADDAAGAELAVAAAWLLKKGVCDFAESGRTSARTPAGRRARVRERRAAAK